MIGRRGRMRALAFIAVGVLATGVGLVLDATGALKRPELDSVDARFSLRGAEPAPKDIAVVEIDDVTFDELNLQWPFPRSWHGRAIDALREDGAEVIVYDIQFTEPSVPKEDQALEQAVDRADNVVLATTEVNKRGHTNVFGGDRVVHRLGADAAMSDLPLDPNGVVRRMLYDVVGRQSLSVTAEQLASGEPITEEEMGGPRAWVDYVGPPGTVETYSFSRLVNGKIPPGTFEGKTVVVGAAAPSLQDVHPTSTSGNTLMSGAEVHANMIATARAGFPLAPASGALNVLLIALAGLAAPLASLFLRVRGVLLIALAVAALIIVGGYLAFENGLITQMLTPLVTLAMSIIGSLAIHYVGAAMDRQRVRDLFTRFVPADVVDEVLDRTDGLRLGGVRREGTVMFGDLRGFTSFAESLEPDQVIEALNHYLGSMSDAIMDEGGTLVAYLGDGIMAVFGAPLEQDDHADRALAAAREMVGPRLAEFNEWLRSEGLSEGFRMGIGLNTGPVMSGNVGSERRVEYTAIGDTTNTAARLEGMTKGTPHQVLIADSTYKALTVEADDVVFFQEAEVRGRQARVSMWGLVEGDGQPTAPP